MRKENLSKRIASCIFATALCAATFAGCGKKEVGAEVGNAGTSVAQEAAVQEENCIFNLNKLSGITDESEFIEYFDYAAGRCVVVAVGDQGDRKYISFKPDGSDVNSFDLSVGSVISSYAVDAEGNFYMQYIEYDEEADTEADEEGVAHAGDDDESEDAASEDWQEDAANAESAMKAAGLVKFDATGKEIFRKDLMSNYKGDGSFVVNSIVWTEKQGLLFNTTTGIMKFDENSGLSTIMECKDFGDKYEGYCTLFKGAGDKLFASVYEGEDGYITYAVDLDGKKLSDPLSIPKEYFYFFAGEGHDFYCADSEAVYGYDVSADKLVKVMDFAQSKLEPDVTGILINYAVALSDKEIIADVTVDTDAFSSNICKLTKAEG